MSAGLLTPFYPREGGIIPSGEELDCLAQAPEGRAVTEITYTWREGKLSLEAVEGQADRVGRKGRGEVCLIPGQNGEYPCMVYLPEGCDSDSRDKRWPLILFFHGIGERGNDPQDLLRQGPPRYVKEGGALEAILAAPQCPPDSHWVEGEDLPRLEAFVQRVVERLPVDPARVYLMGLSMGARCVWRLSLAQPERFAAAAVACGRTECYDFTPIRAMPLWLFHGTDDEIVPFFNVREIISKLFQADHRYFKLTAYPGVRHDCWTAAFGRTDVYDWLLGQRQA